jgi:ribosomal-protein-alanine N-acetyltransferase
MLEVRKENFEAIALYESEGYEKIAERQDYYGPGIDAIVMRKELE